MMTYYIQGNYGQGWEDVMAADDSIEAINLLIDYNDSETQYPHRIKERQD